MADQLREERLAILELLKDGKINSEQAEALLQALAPQTPKAPEAPVFVEPRGGKKDAFKMLRINVDGEDGEKVRINVPIEFAKVLGKGKFGNVNLDEFDIDIESILEMVQNGANGEIVSVESEDGAKVRIVIE